MDKTQLAQDQAWAQSICEALLAGRSQPLQSLVLAFQNLFIAFARRRLFNPQDAEDVLQNVWEELMHGRAICRYAQETEPRVSLKSYCLGILHRRIIDRNRQLSRDRQRSAGDPPELANPGPGPNHLVEQAASDHLARALVHAALIRLARLSPRDAALVRWHLDGLSYEDMAIRLLESEPAAAVSLPKKINAVKKQFTRPGSGSLARFKAVLSELMQQQGLNYDDV